jgi:hypothetical protein
MKRLGQILKKKEPIKYEDEELLRKFNRFLQEDALGCDKAKRISAKAMIWEAYREIHPFRDRSIQWIHGSTSAALPIMMRFQREVGGERPALVPTGMLLKHNLVPLTGELCNGISVMGINRTALSGMGFYNLDVAESYARRRGPFGVKGPPLPMYVMNFEKEKKIIDDYQKLDIKDLSMGSLLRLKVAVLRLLWMRPENVDFEAVKEQINDLKQKIERSKTLLHQDWQMFGGYIGESTHFIGRRDVKSNERLKTGQLVIIGSSYGFVSRYDAKNKKYSVIISKRVGTQGETYFEPSEIRVPEENEKKRLQSKPLEGDLAQMNSLDDDIESIYCLFDTIHSLKPNPEEQHLIGSSFPIVWASCTLQPVSFKGGVRGEIVVQQNAELGVDIQLAFTDKEHVETLRKQVSPFGVTVMSFEAAALKRKG